MKSLFALAALLICTVASATAPCPPEARCDENEFVVMIAASLAAAESACAEMDPSRKAQYADALAHMLDSTFDDEDREDIRNVMNSPLFSAMLKQLESKLREMDSGELARECASFLQWLK